MDLEIEILYENWRKRLMKICFCIVLVLFVAEILLFFKYQREGVLPEPMQYILLKIAVPSVLNLVVLFLGCYVIQYANVNVSIKNEIPVMILMWFCSVILLFHGAISFGVTGFIIPVMLTVIYGSNGFTKIVITMSSVVILIGFIVAMLQEFYHMDYYVLNYATAVLVFLAGCTLANGLMKYETSIKGILRKNLAENQSLKERLMQDKLTGLYTLDGFKELMEKRIQENQKNIVVAVMCFDHREAVLEQSLMQDFAQIIKMKSSLRGFGAYYGKGEFALAFSGSSKQNAKDTVDDIRRALQKYPMGAKMGFDLVSFTACISEYDVTTGEMVEDMLQRVDQSLRKAQGIGGGRNIVI